ncbi:hypothetical protein PHYPSEUDO_011455 [Phytophthora pseudosyringae]|uniref:RxLR effector protein n=1 Tax=Phytophthora pseudosyringae TaxID=221518 RepID=A0A8T1W4Y7_9STRA|nr:hypothetical protein PHYPSEUDO_011455 [Phytophthora pseudosyringae]
MRLFHLVLTLAIVLVSITTSAHETTETATAESNVIFDADHAATRELSDDEERKNGGGRGGRGTKSRGTTTRGRIYGTHTSIGLMNTNSVSHRKTNKCNRFTNWFKRLFNKKIKKCPKEDEEGTRRLRA